MRTEISPRNSLEERVIETQRRLRDEIGAAITGATRRVQSSLSPDSDRRQGRIPGELTMQAKLRRYVGRFAVVSEAANLGRQLEKDDAREIVDRVDNLGMLKLTRAVGVFLISTSMPDSPSFRRENLVSNTLSIRDEVYNLGRGVIARAIKDPVIVAPDERLGTIQQQTYGGVHRAIRTLESGLVLDPEILSQKSNGKLGMIAVVSPFQAKELLGIPEGSMGDLGVAVLGEVGRTPSENVWQPRPTLH